jgi:hypothetical protein
MPEPTTIALLAVVGSIAATAASTGVQISQANKTAEFQNEQAVKQAKRAREAAEQNVRIAARDARRATARQAAAAAGEIFGPTLEVRAAQTARDALTAARNKNFAIGRVSEDAIASAEMRAETARLSAFASGLSGSASILSTGAGAAGTFAKAPAPATKPSGPSVAQGS